MMRATRWSMIAATLVVAHTTARAQTPAYLMTLTVPQRSVGTCMPRPATADSGRAGGPARVAHNLVIVSRPPGARREITLYTDSAGRPFFYVDEAWGFEAPSTGTGVTVLAWLDGHHVVRGSSTKLATRMTPPAPGTRIDSASLAAMGASARSSRRETSLDSTQRSSVEHVAAWLVRRCPG